MKIFILSLLSLCIVAQAQVPTGCPDISGTWTCTKPKYPTAEPLQLEITVETYESPDSGLIYRYQTNYAFSGFNHLSNVGYIFAKNNDNGQTSVLSEKRSGGVWEMHSKCENNKLSVKGKSRVDATNTGNEEYILQPDGTLEISGLSTLIYSWGERKIVASNKICTRN